MLPVAPAFASLNYLKLTCYLGNSAAESVLEALASKLSWSPPRMQDPVEVVQLKLPVTPLQHWTWLRVCILCKHVHIAEFAQSSKATPRATEEAGKLH